MRTGSALLTADSVLRCGIAKRLIFQIGALIAASGILIKAAAANWGNRGSNGGHLTLTADSQILNGNIEVDNISSVAASIQRNSFLSGSINATNTTKAMHLTLDASSKWNVTSDSYLTSLTDTGGISGATVSNIIGNGHTVYYDRNANSALGDRTYSLANGGSLTPR